MPATLNQGQKVYVVGNDEGCGCYGFQNCFDDVAYLADLFAEPAPTQENLGTMALYERYSALLKKYRGSPHTDSTWFRPRTLPAVRQVLSELIENRRTVRVFLGDAATGRSWMEWHDVVGHIERSTGFMKVPLLVAMGEDGGGALLTDCIVKINDAKTGNTLYRHPKFSLPEMKIAPSKDEDHLEGVTSDGTLHAQFKKPGQAARWIAFMKGEGLKP